MKSRRVILTIEIVSVRPLWELRRMELWLRGVDVNHRLDFNQGKSDHIVQVQANAIRPERKAKRAKGAK